MVQDWTPRSPALRTFNLPCEFPGCSETFEPMYYEDWINHMAEHLGHKYPVYCICWYCDDDEFDAKVQGYDLPHNFRLRMLHIYNHIFFNRVTEADRRPDFYLIEHLKNSGLISNAEWKRLIDTSEGPKFLRLPSGPPRVDDFHRSRGENVVEKHSSGRKHRKHKGYYS
jgi:hypothetical protein